MRRHFGDWVMVDPIQPDVTRAQIREDIWGSLRYTAAYWNGPEDWGGHIDPPRKDLVICVQRFHAQQRSKGFSLPGVPRSIAIFGQYWCGHTETARMICTGLDYDFSCVGLVAATQYGYLPSDVREYGSLWSQSRVELTRTFTMDAELGRPRVWAADVWEDIRPLEIALSKARLPYVFYLRPSDEMIEYGARVRTQHGMTELHEHGEAERMHAMRDKASALMGRADPARSQVLQIEMNPALGDWRTAVPENAEDVWFDTYATTAKKALRAVLPPDRLEGRAAGGRAGAAARIAPRKDYQGHGDAGHTEWWRNSAVYQIYLRSFSDGNGDGVGDLAGLRERLPYLADLGVDALWINPWYLSPMVDGGYDVADYRQIDPLFGTLHEAETLIKEAHALQLRVIIDMIPNHTSDQHVWFAAALASEPGSEARDRYIFRPGRGPEGSLPPNDWQAAFGGSAWRRVVSPGGRVEWCLHLFAPEQPDLNWRNPEVRAEFVSILRFWLDRGVDGIRVDVANCIVKPEDLNELEAQPNFTTGIINNSLVMGDHPDVHDVYREWRSVLDSYPGDRMAVGEIWVPDPDRLATYLRPDEFNLVFNFGFLKAPWSAGEMRSLIERTLAANSDVGAPTTWVLANHDVERIATRYGGGDIGRRRALAAFLLVAALPGALYIYQGDELGLEEVTDLPDSVLRDPVWARSGVHRPRS